MAGLKNARIQELEAQNAALKEEVEKYRREAERNYRMLESVNGSTHLAIWIAYFDEKGNNEFVPRLRHMQPSDKELFDGTLLNELATDGNKVVTVALHLMCGFVDEATTFAETHGGGGGGGSDLKWGRDPEEDDREWARRCLAMARKMMMPASGKKKKM